MKLTPIRDLYIGDTFRFKGDRTKYFLNSIVENDRSNPETWLYQVRKVTDFKEIHHLNSDDEVIKFKQPLSTGRGR